MHTNPKPLCQLADDIQNATAEFLRKHPIGRDKYRITADMERTILEICQRHGTPYHTLKKIVTYD